MKKFALSLVLLTSSATSFALDDMNPSQAAVYITGSLSVALASQYLSASVFVAKEANYIVNDVQDYFQTNEMSAFLAQKVNELRSVSSISEEEAIDLLLEKSLVVLGKN